MSLHFLATNCDETMQLSTTSDGTLASMPPYERLKAWQEGHKLVLETYRATKTFPRDELYGLTSQTRRAAFSAAANIVEGSAKHGAREYRRLLDIAIGSLAGTRGAVSPPRELRMPPSSGWPELEGTSMGARVLTMRLYMALHA